MPADGRTAAEAPWYRIDGPYGGSVPPFFPPEEVPWRQHLLDVVPVVRAELDAYLAGPGSFREVFNPEGVDTPGWRSVNLQTYLFRRPLVRHFPRTLRHLDALPGLSSVFINALEPGGRVAPHAGDSNTIVRCHVPLALPADPTRCGIRVADEVRSWRAGEVLALCDAHDHEAWNDADEQRVILVVDVTHPDHRPAQQQVAARVLGATVLRWADRRVGVLDRLSHRRRRAVLAVASAPVRVLLGAVLLARTVRDRISGRAARRA